MQLDKKDLEEMIVDVQETRFRDYNKFFYAEHTGVYLPGYSVAVARNKEEALASIKNLLKVNGLEGKGEEKLKVEDIKEVLPGSAEIIWNGDY